MSSASTMRKISVRNILAHKVRLFLTVLAVVLGTAFVSGAMMFTNALSSTFNSAIGNSFDGVDVVVSANAESGLGGIPKPELDKLRQRSDVQNVNISRDTSVVLAKGDDPKAIQTGSSSPIIGVFYDVDDVVGKPAPLIDGSAPKNPNEVVINKTATESYGLKIGDRLLVIDAKGRYELTISGVTEPELDTAGTIALKMSEDDYVNRYTTEGLLPTLTLSAKDGTDASALVGSLRSDLDPAYSVETGEKLVEEAVGMIRDSLKFVQYFLVAFGLIALLVGTFIIANTFSMIVAQRMREFALLRALGVSQGQLTRSVFFEAIVVGIIGSILGILGGMALVFGISKVLSRNRMPMSTSIGITPTIVLISLAVGIIVTVISAVAPARPAGKVKPVEAMRTIEKTSYQSLKGRTIVGGLLLVLGVALSLAGALLDDVENLTTGVRPSMVGVGALFVIVGTFFFSPAISIPIVGGLGKILGLPFRAVGKLAATNSRRNPRRTATTAFALTLGIALVAAIGTLSATMKDSLNDLMEKEVTADFVLRGPDAQGASIPRESVSDVRNADGVGSVTLISVGNFSVGSQNIAGPGTPVSFTADGNIQDVVAVDEVQGSLDLRNPGFIANKTTAEQNKWALGDNIPVEFNGMEITQVKLIGIYSDSSVLGNYIVSDASLADTSLRDQTVPQLMLVKGNSNINQDQLRENLTNAVADYLIVQVQDSTEYAGEAVTLINMMMNILYALLSLAVIVAVLGIINTLALSVIERRQEIGMLRAVGTKRSQIRTMITLESVQIAVYGAVVGMLIGLGLGWAFVKVMSGAGLGAAPAIPWTELGYMLLGSVVIGIVAALWPAARAAKTPPLEAITD